MKIEVVREACCSQDDQLGPLSIEVDIPERAMVWELAREIGEGDFFSSAELIESLMFIVLENICSVFRLLE